MDFSTYVNSVTRKILFIFPFDQDYVNKVDGSNSLGVSYPFRPESPGIVLSDSTDSITFGIIELPFTCNLFFQPLNGYDTNVMSISSLISVDIVSGNLVVTPVNKDPISVALPPSSSSYMLSIVCDAQTNVSVYLNCGNILKIRVMPSQILIMPTFKFKIAPGGASSSIMVAFIGLWLCALTGGELKQLSSTFATAQNVYDQKKNTRLTFIFAGLLTAIFVAIFLIWWLFYD